MKRILWLSWALWALAPSAAHASSAQDAVIHGSGAFLEGKFYGTGLNHTGGLVLGYSGEPSRTEDASYLLDVVRVERSVYIAGGNRACVLAYSGGKLTPLVSFSTEVAVTALAADARTLYAATLPGAKIYKVGRKGDTELFADFASGHQTPNYIWSMQAVEDGLVVGLGGHFPAVYFVDFKKAQKTLIQKLGGKGRNVTAIAPFGKDVYYGDDAGNVWVSPRRLDSTATVLYAFSKAEVRKIVPDGTGLYVAVNSRGGPGQPPPQQAEDKKGEEEPAPDETDEGGEFGEADVQQMMENLAEAAHQQMLESAENEEGMIEEEVVPADDTPAPAARRGEEPVVPPTPPSNQPPAPPAMFSDPFGKGAGNVFWLDSSGQHLRKLWTSLTSPVLSLDLWDGQVVLGTSQPARLYILDDQGREQVIFESASKDLGALMTSAGDPRLAVVSNPAAVVELKPAASGAYLSKIFDAGLPARYGRWDAWGDQTDRISMELRTGNTPDVDSSWTPYEQVAPAASPKVRGRFMQARVTLADRAAELRRLRISYQLPNQRPILRNLTSIIENKGEAGRALTLRWNADNPDQDDLAYRISYRPPGSEIDVAVFPEGVQLRNALTYSFRLDDFEDGTYLFRLTVTDAPSNSGADALESNALFPPVLIDRRAPQISLKPGKDGVSWTAADDHSRVVNVQFRFDNAPWSAVTPADEMFDSLSESGWIAAGAGPDRALLTVKAADEQGNVSVKTLVVQRR